MPRYSLERKGAVLKKLLPPENQPVPVVSEAEGISQGTLYNWLCQVKDGGGVVPGSRTSNSEQWSSDAKLAVVLETQSLNEAEKAEYCRLKGLYPAQIERWRLACLSDMSSKEPCTDHALSYRYKSSLDDGCHLLHCTVTTAVY